MEYAWERPISTQQTALHLRVAVAGLAARPGRRPVSGTAWTIPTPPATFRFYCGIDALPKSFTGGSIGKFSWDSAWWVFNFVSNYAYLKWSHMMPEIRACQKDIESNFLALQPAVEKTAVELPKTSPNLMAALPDRLLDDARRADGRPLAGTGRAPDHEVQRRLRPRRRTGNYPEVGYPEAWLRRVLRERPEQFRLPVEKPAEKAGR